MDVRIKQEAPDADAPTMTSSSDVTTQQQHLLNINSLLMSITSSPLLGLPTSLASTHTYLQQFIANSAQSGIPPSDVTALATADLALNLAVRQAQSTGNDALGECAALDLSAKKVTPPMKPTQPHHTVTSSPTEGATPIDFTSLKSEAPLKEGASHFR